jgi:hypothetical protein
MVNPDLLCRPPVSKDQVPLSRGLLGAMLLGLLVGSGVSLAGKSEAGVTPTPLDMSIVQGFARGDGAAAKAATAPAQPAVEAKTEAPMASAPVESAGAPVPASPVEDRAAAVADAPQRQSSMPTQGTAAGAATPAGKPKPSAAATTLDRSIIQGFAKDTMQKAEATSAVAPDGSSGTPGPVPVSTPAQADASSRGPLPDDQMNLIREVFSGDGSG